MADAIQLARGHAGFDVGSDVVEDFCRQAAGDAHFFDFFGGFDDDAHCFSLLDAG